jgi:uncharacterized protein (TIGR02246 family)
MLRIVWAAWLLVAAVPCPAAGVDQQAVRAIVLRQAVAWNRHDAAAYSSLFTPDCDVVNIAGWWWKSRAEVHQKLARAFSGVFAHSTLTFTDVQVKFPGPDIAVAHAQWKMSGARMPPGMPAPDAGIQTLVLARQRDGKWLIAEFQNTLSRPEHPFPTPIPAAPGSAARGH